MDCLIHPVLATAWCVQALSSWLFREVTTQRLREKATGTQSTESILRAPEGASEGAAAIVPLGRWQMRGQWGRRGSPGRGEKSGVMAGPPGCSGRGEWGGCWKSGEGDSWGLECQPRGRRVTGPSSARKGTEAGLQLTLGEWGLRASTPVLPRPSLKAERARPQSGHLACSHGKQLVLIVIE